MKPNPWMMCAIVVICFLMWLFGCTTPKELTTINIYPRSSVNPKPLQVTNTDRFAAIAPVTNPPVRIVRDTIAWDWYIGQERITNYPIYVGGKKVHFEVFYATSLQTWKLLGMSYSNSYFPIPTNLQHCYFRVATSTNTIK